MVQPFSLPGTNYFGRGALAHLSVEISRFKARNVFLLSDRGLFDAGIIGCVESEIKKAVEDVDICLDVEKEPTLANVELCLGKYLDKKYDLIVGLGGGSPLDVAKAISVLAKHEGPILDYVGVDLVPGPGIPLILIPTTSGTGSEVTKNAIFTDPGDQTKKGVVSRYLLPEVAIVDSELTMSLPAAVTAATGMDALTHAIEAYTSPKATMQTDFYALKAIELIGKSLRKAVAIGQDHKAREDMSMASVFAGIALANAGVGAVHACAYPLGGRFGMAHGVTNALLLPHIMEYNLIGDVAKFASVASALGEVTDFLSLREQAELSRKAVFELSQDIGIPQKLSAFGVKKEDIPSLAEAAMKVTRLMDNNPRKLSLAEVKSCLYNALD